MSRYHAKRDERNAVDRQTCRLDLTSTSREIIPQTRKGRHERIVLHALALLAPQTPTQCQTTISVDRSPWAARGPILLYSPRRWSIPGTWRHGRVEGRARAARSTAQDGRDGGVRPAGMLPHGRRDGYTFRRDEGDRVDRDRDRRRACEGLRHVGGRRARSPARGHRARHYRRRARSKSLLRRRR